MIKLIVLYFYVDERYNKEWKYYNERFSNNKNPVFSDEEILVIYLYGTIVERRFRIKDIYDFTKNYLLSYFPKLPSYQSFNDRLNRMDGIFKLMLREILELRSALELKSDSNVVDSLPIVICSGKRKSKVAKEMSEKGYCSTKGMYYYGLKIHINGRVRKGMLPLPECIVVSSAAENDLNVFRDNWYDMNNRVFYGDKIYTDEDWFKVFEQQTGSIMLTPVKAVKGMADRLKKLNKAADDLWSKAVHCKTADRVVI
jgi:hypothetical protein